METVKLVGFFVAIVLIPTMILCWSSKHDKAVMEAGDKYEKCVWETYRTTPSAWYNEHGSYPECR